MSRADELRAQLALAELEEELTQAKAARETPEVAKARKKLKAARDELRELLAAAPDLTDIKARVREARQAAREARPAPVPAEAATEGEGE